MPALGERLKALFEAEPLPPLVTGYALANEDGKSFVLTFSELVEGLQGSGTVVVWRREFATTELAHRAKGWLMRAQVMKAWERLVALVRSEGAQALDAMIDRELAARPRRRRR